MPVEIRKLVVTREDVDFEGFKSTERPYAALPWRRS